MAREQLETHLTATDSASKVIQGVADEAEKLEKLDPNVKVDADDKASAEIEAIRKKAASLDGDTAEVYLKAEARNAKRDVAALQREIIALDGEDATVLVKAKDDASRRLDAISDDLAKLDATVAEPKVEAPDAGKAGDRAGSMFSMAAIKGIGVAGIGAAIVSVFNAGMDKIKVRAKMAAQFGLVKEDAERLSKEAADIYAGNWGESIGEVSQVIGTVKQQLVDVGVVSEAEMGKVAESAIVVATAFDADVNQVIRSTSQLLLNGLAPDAESALDMVVVALQEGGNKADDFWDTIDEYSQHFGAMGLSGEDMMKVITHGLQNGQRDSDKLADAIKEMRVKTTDSTDAISVAYDKIGLNADEYRRKVLAGGDSAREAYIDILKAIQSVDDPIEQNALAVELIGTMYEDLGPKAIDSLLAIEGATQDATGATDELNAGLSESASEFEKLQRQVEASAGEYAELAAKVANWGVESGAFISVLQGKHGDAIDAITGKNDELTGSFERVTPAVMATSATMVQAEIDAALLEHRTKDLGDATEDTAEEVEAAREAFDAETEAVKDLLDEMETLIDRKRRLVGSTGDVTRAEIAARDAVRDLDKALKDETLSQDERTIAMLDATDAQIDAATAIADAEIAQREANGETVGAATAANIQADALRNVAGTLEPGSMLQKGLLDMADNIDNIPKETAVQITSNAAEQDLLVEQLTRRINGVPTNRTVNFTINERTNRTVWSGRGGGAQSHVGSRFDAGETKIVVPGQVFTPDVPGRMSSVEESARQTGSGRTGRDSGAKLVLNLMDRFQVEAVVSQRDADLLAGLAGGVRP